MIMELAALKVEQLFFAKFDISNMFWMCCMPKEYQHSVRNWMARSVYSFPSLPFG